jgi:hypothetical protein
MTVVTSLKLRMLQNFHVHQVHSLIIERAHCGGGCDPAEH